MRIRATVADLADSLSLPPEAVGSEPKITLYGRRHAVVEHHKGLLGYTQECVEVGLERGKLRLLGRELTLRAMDAQTLLVAGQISAVEYG